MGTVETSSTLDTPFKGRASVDMESPSSSEGDTATLGFQTTVPWMFSEVLFALLMLGGVELLVTVTTLVDVLLTTVVARL